jgi:hypothetical protein
VKPLSTHFIKIMKTDGENDSMLSEIMGIKYEFNMPDQITCACMTHSFTWHNSSIYLHVSCVRLHYTEYCEVQTEVKGKGKVVPVLN